MIYKILKNGMLKKQKKVRSDEKILKVKKHQHLGFNLYEIKNNKFLFDLLGLVILDKLIYWSELYGYKFIKIEKVLK